MSAPTVDALSGAFWNMATEPEFQPCKSVLHLINGDPARSAWCEAPHEESGEKAHRAQIQGHTVFWSAAQAAERLAAFRELPECAKCGFRYLPGEFLPYCRKACALADKHTDDEREIGDAA